ncbi:MAG TPA: hypothetical protein DCG38_05900 [Eubacteriaceae bacterium]|nr:hypothetical protein [Eubacteriaceae bacterium]
MDFEKILIILFVVFGIGMFFIGIADLIKNNPKNYDEMSKKKSELNYLRIQGIIDLTTGFAYALLGISAYTGNFETKYFYVLVLAIALVRKIINMVIKNRLYKIK